MKQTSGLKIKVNIKKSKATFTEALYMGAALGMMLCGMLLMMNTMADFLSAKVFSAIFAFVLPIVTLATSSAFSALFLLYAFPTAAVLIMLIAFSSETANGAIVFYNHILEIFGRNTGRIMPLAEPIKPVENADIAAFSALAVSVALLAFMLSGKSRLAVCLSVFPVAAFALLCLSDGADKIGFSLTVTGAVMLILSVQTQSAKNYGEFFRRVVAVAVCLAVLCVSALPSENVGFLIQAKASIADKLEDLRYGKNVLPQGNFSEIGNFEPSSDARLEVVMSKPDSYYLRGFVGTEYNGNGWSETKSESLYEYSDLFYWLHQSGFYGQTQLAAVADTVGRNETENRIIIRNINASRKYIYAPYEAKSVADISYEAQIGDEGFKSSGFSGCNGYTLTAASNQVKLYTTIAAELYEKEKSGNAETEKYLKNEAHYNSFVYENFTDIPERTSALLENLLGKYTTENSHMEYGEAKQRILAFLTANMTYSTDAEPTDGDFAESFLQVTRKGYSVHFATAAALMFRYYGIPARYVEGYLITPEDIKNVIPDSAITLDESRAHAWVEFYQDGIGWIPFETTPVYLNIMEKADDLNSIGSKTDKTVLPQEKHDEDENERHIEGSRDMKRQKTKRTVLTVAAVTAAFGIFAAAIAALIFAFLNKKKLMKLKALFACESSDKAVIGLYGYAAGFIYKDDCTYNTVCFSQKDEADAEAFEIYEKARFGAQAVSDNERAVVKRFADEAVKKFCNSRSRWQRFLDKRIRYLY